MARSTRKRHGPRRRTGRAVAEPKPQPPETPRRDRLLPALLFLACFGAYVGNGDFLHGSDQEGNMLFSVNLLKRHSFSLTLPDAPASFHWKLEEPGREARRVEFDEELYEQGRLTPTAYP